jgi:hypothetical protein
MKERTEERPLMIWMKIGAADSDFDDYLGPLGLNPNHFRLGKKLGILLPVAGYSRTSGPPRTR